MKLSWRWTVTDAEVHELIEQTFRREADFVEVALTYLRKSHSLPDRFLGRHKKFKPMIHAEAVRLMQFSILRALQRSQAGNPEQQATEHLLNFLYGISIAEATQRLPDYFDQEKAPGHVFAQNIWDQTGSPRDFEIFVAFNLHVNKMLASLIDIFVLAIEGLAKDPNGYFHEWVGAMTERYKGRGSKVTGDSCRDLPIMELLNTLETQRTITIGLHRRAANDYWAHTSKIGAVANIGILAIIGLVFYFFIFVSWKFALLALVGLVIYVRLIEKIGLTIVRTQLLKDEAFFQALYDAGLATVRVNSTGDIIRSPADWRPHIERLVTEDSTGSINWRVPDA